MSHDDKTLFLDITEANLTSLSIVDVVNLLSVIQAEYFQAILGVLRNFPDVIKHLPEDVSVDIDDYTYMANISKYIYDNKSVYRNIILFHADKLPNRRNFDGIIECAPPLYCALGHRPDVDDEWPRFRNLLSQLFAAVSIYTKRRVIPQTSLALACRAVRHISYGENFRLLLELPEEQVNQQTYISKLSLLEKNPYAIKLPSYEDLVSFLRQAAGILKEKTPLPRSTTKEFGFLPPQKTKEYARRGISLGDIRPRKEPVTGNPRNPRNFNRTTLRASRLAARVRKNAMAFKNQNLKISTSVTSLNDFSILMNKIQTGVDTGTFDPQVASILLTAIWLGQEIDDVLSFHLLMENQTEVEQGTNYLVWTEEGSYWRIYSPGPYIQKPERHVLLKTCPTHDFIDLDTPDIIRPILKKYINSISLTSQKSHKLYTITNEIALIECQEYISFINARYNTELTTKRLTSFMGKNLIRHPSGDVAISLLITGNSAHDHVKSKPSHPKAYYTSINTADLQNIYSSTCDYLSKTIFKGIQQSLEPITFCHDHSLYMGTPLRAKDGAVKSLVITLKNKISDLRPCKDATPQQIAQFHTAYTVYTALYINFVIALRATRNPALLDDQIDPKTGFAIIKDKDRGDNQNCRRVLIPKQCRIHLDYYHQHISNFYSALHNYSPSLLRLFPRLQPGRTRYYFTMGDDLKIVLLRPSNLEKILHNHHFPLPVNWSRHYLRSKLLERNCPRECINALLGHDEQGQEPWTRLTLFHPEEYINSLSHHLVDILKDDGWEPLPGLTQQ